MNYKEIKITTTHAGADSVCAMLSPYCTGFIVDDPQDVLEFSLSKTTKWDYIDDALLGNPDRQVSVTFYLNDDEHFEENLGKIKSELLPFSAPELLNIGISVCGVKSEDWENNWKQYYKPFCVGETLLVRPSWESIPQEAQNRTVLTIDPASSFGTGSHATTRLCLEELTLCDLTEKTVLDVGCGSGILCSSMLLLGASQAYACDIEENAVRTTAENILLNGIERDRFSVFLGDILSDAALRQKLCTRKYDVICANIVADVLISMSDILLSALAPDGILIISGIIDSRASEVTKCYTDKNVHILKSISRDGWTMLRISLQ